MECFSLGNLDARRDWGHAKDYVEVGYWPESLYNKSDFVWLIFLMHRCKIKLSDLQGVTSDFFWFRTANPVVFSVCVEEFTV